MLVEAVGGADVGVLAGRWSSAARGAILNVASTAGMQPMPYSAGYSAAKAYVLTFSEALHQELRGHGRDGHRARPGAGRDGLLGDRRAGRRPAASRSSGRCRGAPDLARAGRPRRRRGPRLTASAWSSPGCRSASAMLASRYMPHAIKLPAIERVMRPAQD